MDVAAFAVRCLENHPTILGETYGFWCQNLILLVAAFVAWKAITNSRAIERRKASAEVIFSSRKDSDLLSSIHKISVIHHSSTNIASFAKHDKSDGEEARCIRYALNHYEYIAVGIDQGIYDEAIFKSSHYSTVLKLYEHSKSYIDERRRIIGKTTTYQDLECLALRWKEDPLEHKPIRSMQARHPWWKFWK
jgi:hypothetical protein